MRGEKGIKIRILQEMGDSLFAFKEIEIGYVFGSFLEREEFEDIDVALQVSKKFSPYRRGRFAMRVGREMEKNIQSRYEIDVKILNNSPLSFQYQVIKNGKPIFIRNELKRIHSEVKIMSKYLDQKYYQNRHNEILLEQIKKEGIL